MRGNAVLTMDLLLTPNVREDDEEATVHGVDPSKVGDGLQTGNDAVKDKHRAAAQRPPPWFTLLILFRGCILLLLLLFFWVVWW